MEGSREPFRQDREIALNKSVGDARRGRGHPSTAFESSLPARKGILAFLEMLACRQNGHDIAPPIVSTAVERMHTIKSNLAFQSS